MAPGSPYKNMDNTLWTIRYAREHDIPLLGTCGGFQHVIIEIARNVLGIEDAEHAEYDPYINPAIKYVTREAHGIRVLEQKMHAKLLPV